MLHNAAVLHSAAGLLMVGFLCMTLGNGVKARDGSLAQQRDVKTPPICQQAVHLRIRLSFSRLHADPCGFNWP